MCVGRSVARRSFFSILLSFLPDVPPTHTVVHVCVSLFQPCPPCLQRFRPAKGGSTDQPATACWVPALLKPPWRWQELACIASLPTPCTLHPCDLPPLPASIPNRIKNSTTTTPLLKHLGFLLVLQSSTTFFLATSTRVNDAEGRTWIIQAVTWGEWRSNPIYPGFCLGTFTSGLKDTFKSSAWVTFYWRQ